MTTIVNFGNMLKSNKNLYLRTINNIKTVNQQAVVKSPDIDQIKASLREKIIGTLEDRKLSVREAQAVAKFTAADFSRIRNGALGRFTIDRLIKILNKLDQRVNIHFEFNSIEKKPS